MQYSNRESPGVAATTLSKNVGARACVGACAIQTSLIYKFIQIPDDPVNWGLMFDFTEIYSHRLIFVGFFFVTNPKVLDV
jgi:hypothetical protein